MAKKIIKKEVKKDFPWLIMLAIIVLIAIILFFVAKTQTPTGEVTTGGAITTVAVSPISSGLVISIAAGAMLLIAIFAGIGKRGF